MPVYSVFQSPVSGRVTVCCNTPGLRKPTHRFENEGAARVFFTEQGIVQVRGTTINGTWAHEADAEQARGMLERWAREREQRQQQEQAAPTAPSPFAPRPATDTDIADALSYRLIGGQYRSLTLEEVYRIDREYLRWLEANERIRSIANAARLVREHLDRQSFSHTLPE